jgi:DNA-binding SARP family transcriptional activator
MSDIGKLQLKLLGRLQVTNNDVALTPTLRPRAQRLLSYLLLHRHTPYTRESIAFALWPDYSEKEALGMLRRALSELRAALPSLIEGEWIVSARGELYWNLYAPYWLDLEVFEQLIRRATPAAFHQAVTLYSGDLLADWDEEWVLVERERLRQRQLNALRQLVAHHRALAEYETALHLAHQTLALDPLAEAIYRDLMALHYEAGDRAAALAEYDRLCILLREELGVEPMAETQKLRAAIVQGAPLSASEVSVVSLALTTPPDQAQHGLIGREAEMAQLSALWENAAVGRGRFAFISGEAGVGKSCLALSLTNYVAQQGGLALIGHCYEFERALPYQAIVEMLRSAAHLLRQADFPAAHRVTLARLTPEVMGLTGSLAEEIQISPDDLRAQLFEGLLQAFLALARSQPLLLLFEDAHWAAESTLDWLTYIAPHLNASRLLVVITYRTDEVGAEHALARLGRRFASEGTVSTVALKPLSREVNREWVAHLSGLEESLAIPVADRLFAETAGNPFFLQEIVRGLIEAGQIVVGEGRWVGAFVEAAPGAVVPLPESLRETIKARLERLTEMARTFLRVAAVAGRVFEYELVRQAEGWADELALGALEELLMRGFIREGEGKGGFAFAHHLVQEAIYADLTTPRRTYWHRRLAEAIEALHPDDFEALAYHFIAAGERDTAIEYSWRAAQRAEALYAYEEAIPHLRTALRLIERGAQPETRLTLLEALADNYRLLRQGIEAISTYQVALDLWYSLREADKIMAVRLHRKIFQTTAGMWETTGFQHFEFASQVSTALRAKIDDLLPFMEDEPSHPEIVSLLKVLAVDALILRFPSEWDEAVHYAQEAVVTAERLDAPVELASALTTLASVYGVRGLLRERVEVALRALALSRDPRFDDVRERIHILIGVGSALVHVGEYTQAAPYFQEAESLADQVRAVHDQNRALSLLHQCWFRLDRWDEMFRIEKRRRALQQLYPLERVGAPCFAIGLSAAVHALRGEFEQAKSLREESYAIMIGVSGPPEHWKRSHRY